MVPVLSLVQHHGDAQFRIICREKADERREILFRSVNLIDDLLRRARFTRYSVAIESGLGGRPFFGRHHFQRFYDLFGRAFPEDGPGHTRIILGKHCPILVLQTIDQHRPHQLAAIGDGGHGHDHLQMSHTDRMPHRNTADHEFVIPELVHVAVDLATEGNPGLGSKSEGLYVVVELLFAQLVNRNLGCADVRRFCDDVLHR